MCLSAATPRVTSPVIALSPSRTPANAYVYLQVLLDTFDGRLMCLQYNCGEQGHNKSECTNPRVERKFTGTCNLCGEAGHRRADCPQKGPETCRACGKEGTRDCSRSDMLGRMLTFITGHIATECTANRLLAAYKVDTELTAEQAWEALQKADAEKDVEEIKKSILAYAKAYPELTLYDLESSFRDANFNTYLIGKEQAISVTHTIVNLEGKPGQKFVVSVQWADKPRRAKFAEGWPTSKEDNMARLAEAGFVLDGFVTKCDNCNEVRWRSSQVTSCTDKCCRSVIPAPSVPRRSASQRKSSCSALYAAKRGTVLVIARPSVRSLVVGALAATAEAKATRRATALRRGTWTSWSARTALRVGAPLPRMTGVC